MVTLFFVYYDESEKNLLGMFFEWYHATEFASGRDDTVIVERKVSKAELLKLLGE